MQIHVSNKVAATIDRELASGAFQSADEVVAASLEALVALRELEARKLLELRGEVLKGVKTALKGRVVSVQQAWSELNAKRVDWGRERDQYSA